MKLYAISDLHLDYEANRRALESVRERRGDWLILAGDVGHKEKHLHLALSIFTAKYGIVIWTPGNHDLWTVSSCSPALRGAEKHHRLISICRDYGVATPEDPFVEWHGEGPACVLAPVFCLDDYSFRPDPVSLEDAVPWAAEAGAAEEQPAKG